MGIAVGTNGGVALHERRSQIPSEIAALIDEYFALGEDGQGADEAITCPLAAPLFDAREVRGAVDALLSKRITMGACVRAFELTFANYAGTKHAVMVNSGSSANLLAVSIVCAHATPGGLRPGDEVIVPAVTWSTTVAPIVQLGLVPVFVDIDPDTLNVDCDQLERAISKRTRAIFAVHLLGNPADMRGVVDLARAHELWLLEDSCEALGSTFGETLTGAFGHAGTFSFFFSHQIATGEGGMLVTDDDRLADVARSMRAHGWVREMSCRAEIEAANPTIDSRFLFAHLGYNLRPTEIQGAFGMAQLPRLDSYNAARCDNARFLADALGDLPTELRLVREQEGGSSTWFGFPMLVRDETTRLALARHLEQRGIETRPVVAGNLTLQPAFRDTVHRTVGDLPGATAVGERGIFVGNHPGMSERQLTHTVTAIRSFFGTD